MKQRKDGSTHTLHRTYYTCMRHSNSDQTRHLCKPVLVPFYIWTKMKKVPKKKQNINEILDCANFNVTMENIDFYN